MKQWKSAGTSIIAHNVSPSTAPAQDGTHHPEVHHSCISKILKEGIKDPNIHRNLYVPPLKRNHDIITNQPFRGRRSSFVVFLACIVCLIVCILL